MARGLQASEVRELSPKPGCPAGVQFTPDGGTIVVATLFGIALYSAETGKQLQVVRLSRRARCVAAWAISSCGERLLWGSTNEDLRLIDLSGHEILRLTLPQDAQGYLFAETPGLGSTATVYHPDGSFEDLSCRYAAYRTVSSVAMSHDGNLAIAAYGQAYALVWDLATGELRHCLGKEGPEGNPTRIYRVALTPDGRYALTRDSTHRIRLWDLDTASQIHHWQTREDPYAEAVDRPHDLPTEPFLCGGLGAIGFTPDSKRAVAAEGTVVVSWDLATDHSYSSWVGHNESHPILSEYEGVPRILDLRFSSDGQRALTVGVDTTIRVWDVPTGKQVWAVRPDTCCIDWADIAPDGRRVAWAGCPGARLYPLHSTNADSNGYYADLLS